ncbi:MAG: CvpA family protein [Gallionella sp.]|jgi:membrane protein required for colicin V production
MEHTTLNLFDLIVFGIVGLSAMMSFFRGFVREVLSLGAWVGAALITVYAFPAVAEMLKPHVKNEAVANGFASLFTFMGALIIISIFTGLLRKLFKSGSDIGLLDNGLGLVFGAMRGALLVAVAFFVFGLTTAKADYPDWMKGALTLPYVEAASTWVAAAAPEYIKDISGDDTDPDKAKEKLDNAVDDAKKRSQEIKDHVQDKWPTMDDLKDRMNSDEPVGGGY